jgi:hypothetical protein
MDNNARTLSNIHVHEKFKISNRFQNKEIVLVNNAAFIKRFCCVAALRLKAGGVSHNTAQTCRDYNTW